MAKVSVVTFSFLVVCSFVLAKELALKTIKEDTAVSIRHVDNVVVTYQLEPEKNTKLSVESGCYFHPLMTPAGVVVTEVGPGDHTHHRGVFLAWVEMHGKKDADFWGWASMHRRRTGASSTAT